MKPPLFNAVIHWLIQTADAHPDLTQGQPPDNFLTGGEKVVFKNLKVEKRKKDWLLGRWTAKQLLQRVVFQEHGQRLPFEVIAILAGEDGAPRVHIDPASFSPQNNYSISISHAKNTAFCALVKRENWPVGADLEWIESRTPGFAENYFTENEQQFLQQIEPENNDFWLTALWSAKEAAFKAVRQGLRLDTRQIECRFENLQRDSEDWVPFSMQWRRGANGHYPRLQGWLKATEDYVLTLAIEAEQEIIDHA